MNRPIIINTMKNKVLSAFLLAALLFPLYAQEEVFSPFVSRLKAAVRGPEIKLTWTDSPDMEGACMVYRHTAEITGETFRDAALVARVEPGVEYYIDSPPMRGEFYYAVLLSTGGRIFDVFIPFRNKTTRAIPVESTMAETDLAALISNIDARPEKDGIEISFTSSRADRELILYRSATPVFSAGQLGISNIVKKLRSLETRITDYPVPGVPFYYAVVDAKLLETGSAVLEPGKSVTVKPAEVPLPKEDLPVRVSVETPAETGRPMPLPYYYLSGRISGEGGLAPSPVHEVPPRRSLPPAVRKAADALAAKAARPVPPDFRPVILQSDKALGTSREEYTLKTILSGPFLERNWRETAMLLTHFLNMHLSEDMRAKAHFYRAQSLFFQREYKESFMEFLPALDGRYAEVRPWLDEILRLTGPTADPSGG